MDNRPSRHRHGRLRSSRCESPLPTVAAQREIGGAHMRIGLLTDGGYPYTTGETRAVVRPARARARAARVRHIRAQPECRAQEQQGLLALPPHVRQVRHRAARGPRRSPLPGRGRGDGAGTGAVNAGSSPCTSDAWPPRSAATTPPAAAARTSPRGCTGSPPSPASTAGSRASSVRDGRPHPGSRLPHPRRQPRRPPPGSPTTSPSRACWNAPCARSPSTGTATTRSARSTSAMPLPAAARPCPGSWPNASAGSRSWSPSTASSCAPSTSPAPNSPSPYGRCGRLSAPARRRGVRAGRADHPRQHPHPPMAGALRRRPRQAAHRLSRHVRRPVPRGGEGAYGGDPDTLVWVGRIEPAKDLIALLHAFAEVRKAEPERAAAA